MLIKIILATLRGLRPLFRAHPRFQFFCALLTAGLGDMVEKWRGLREALKTGRAVGTRLVARRLSVCRKCPMYFAPLGTCGSPLFSFNIEGFRGCHCHCETKAGTKTNCPAYDHFKGRTIVGWPAALNSFPNIHERRTS